MSEDDHPGPFCNIDFSTMIDVIKGGEQQDRERFIDFMRATHRKSYYEMLYDIQAEILKSVPQSHHDSIYEKLHKVISSMASLAMVEYEYASTRKQLKAANSGKSAKGDRIKGIVRDLVEEHQKTHAGGRPTAAQLVAPLKNRCASQDPPLKPVGRVQISRYLRKL